MLVFFFTFLFSFFVFFSLVFVFKALLISPLSYCRYSSFFIFYLKNFCVCGVGDLTQGFARVWDRCSATVLDSQVSWEELYPDSVMPQSHLNLRGYFQHKQRGGQKLPAIGPSSDDHNLGSFWSPDPEQKTPAVTADEQHNSWEHCTYEGPPHQWHLYPVRSRIADKSGYDATDGELWSWPMPSLWSARNCASE